MISNTSKNKIILSVIVLIVGFIATYLQFAPLFNGKKLNQHDIAQAVASQKEIIDFRAKTGKEALWTDRMFGGMPLYVTSTRFNNNWSETIAFKLRFLPRSADVIFLSFLCCFIMLVCFKVHPIVAGIGAIAYGFNTFSMVSTEAGHIFKILAIAYAPLVIAGLVLVFRKKYILGLGLLSLAITLELASKHYQITYYLAFFGGIYVVFEFVKMILQKDFKHLVTSIGVLLVASLIGLGPHISRLWSINDYNKYSTRGKRVLTISSNPEEKKSKASSGLEKDYAFSWSQGKLESLTLFIPGLYGGASNQELSKESDLTTAMIKKRVSKKQTYNFIKGVPLYWGDQPMTAGPVYAGGFIGFLFILFLLNKLNYKKYSWVLFSGVILLMISWGRNLEWFNYTLFDHFPLFNKFRSVSMAITFVVLAMTLTGSIGLNEFLKLDKENRQKLLVRSFIVYFAIILIIWLGMYLMASFKSPTDSRLKESVPGWLYKNIVEERKAFFNGTMLRVILFSSLSGLLLFIYDNKSKMKYIVLGSLLVLVTLDLATMNNKYLNADSFVKTKKANKMTASPANKTIQKDKGHYRVFDYNNPFNNANTSYYHNSLGGYHGAKMRRYQDLIDFHLSQNNQKVLDMFNTKYLITQDGKNAIPRNTNLGNAWFVKNVKAVENANEAILYLGKEEFDPKSTAVINTSEFSITGGPTSSGNINLTRYEPNYLIYESENNNGGLAVFSEIYYDKGWNAYIDGKPVDHIRANYILRALEIPAGKHTIEFKFEPASFYTGEKIALLFSILLVLVVLSSFGYEAYLFLIKPQENAPHLEA